AVISAYAPPQDHPDEIVGVTQRQVEALSQAPNARLIVVGGAGGLNVAPGVTLIDSGYLPEPYLPIAKAHLKALNVLRAAFRWRTTRLHWSMSSKSHDTADSASRSGTDSEFSDRLNHPFIGVCNEYTYSPRTEPEYLRFAQQAQRRACEWRRSLRPIAAGFAVP